MYLTVDIGGTKTFIALFDARHRIVKSVKFPTDHDQGKFLNTFFNHIQDYLSANPTNIVVAVAGVIKDNRPTWFGNLPWHNPPLFETIKKLFTCPVFFINDADSATLYESHFYSGKSIYLTFSTGIGGGIATTPKTLTSKKRIATLAPESANFEPGHKIYIWQNRPCEWEDIASANAVRKAYGDRPVTSLHGKSTYFDIASRVAVGLTTIILDHQPDTIIMGGPLALTLKKWRMPLKMILRDSLPGNLPLPKIRQAKKPNLCVSYGACLYGELKSKELAVSKNTTSKAVVEPKEAGRG